MTKTEENRKDKILMLCPSAKKKHFLFGTKSKLFKTKSKLSWAKKGRDKIYLSYKEILLSWKFVLLFKGYSNYIFQKSTYLESSYSRDKKDTDPYNISPIEMRSL